jgi:hypothetical protein
MNRIRLCLIATTSLCLTAGAQTKQNVTGGSRAPGCAAQTAQQCVELALDAMGGRERLLGVTNVRLTLTGYTLLTEQSYRQAPFITSYERDLTTLDLNNQRLRTEAKGTWPESDPNQAESETTLIAGPGGGVHYSRDGDKDNYSRCGLSELDDSRQMLALGPLRLLLTASAAGDLHFEAPETLRSTSHTVVAFTWNKVPVRVVLNGFNHLPDAVETTQQFRDFWYYWGDVKQRVYFDNFQRIHGMSYPTNLVVERNGIVWSSTQTINIEFNVPLDPHAFDMDDKVAQASEASPGWDRPFAAKTEKQLAPGIDLFPASWNTTVIRQSDGIVILEAPISGIYVKGLFDEARKRYPGATIKAVLSTSDSWPHAGGVRQAVAEKLPVYILDLNRPLLDRMLEAPHSLAPDALAKTVPATKPDWKIVSEKTLVGSGDNRMELYPLRGASTERQYMVYFPAHHLLYASDTLVLNGDGSLYDPELMHEVVQAVDREHLAIDTVYAMHQEPVPWSQVISLIEKLERS